MNHDHTCHCGGMEGPHTTGLLQCFRQMTESPKRHMNGQWHVPNARGGVTDYTLRYQWGYHQHPCGCWSRATNTEDQEC